MNTTATPRVESIEHEGFFYVETSNGIIAKGCSRCGGTGHYSFNGMDSICYKCSNVWEYRLGDIFETRAQAEKWCHERAVRKAQYDRKKEAERLAKLAKRTAAWDALEAAHPEVWALLTSVVNVRTWDQPEGDVYPSATERDSFILKMADQLWRLDERPFSARVIEVLQDKATKRTAQKAEAAEHPAPSGRVAVTGEIVSTRVVEGDYGTSYKILVKDDRGFKVWGSLPKAQADEAYDAWYAAHEGRVNLFGHAVWFLGTEYGDEQETGVKGRRITFTATLEPSKDDVAFAFASRPTKGAWV